MNATGRNTVGNGGADEKTRTPERAMSRFARSFALLLSFTGLLLGAADASAAACTSAATGNWNAAATWLAPCNVVGGPVAADTVTIAAAHTVTVTANAAALSITTTAPTAANGITISGTNSLTVSGAITLAQPTANFTTTVAVGTGTLTAASIALNGGSNANRVTQVTVSTGTVTVSGNVTTAGTAAQSRFVASGAAIINIGGNFTPGAFTASTSTLTFNGGGAQSVGAFTYNNLTINKAAGTATTAGVVTVGGALNVTQGTLAVIGSNFTASGVTNVGNGTLNGTINQSLTGGTAIFTGLVTIYSGSSWTNTANKAVTFRGGITNNGTFTAGTAVQTFNTNAQVIGGVSAISIPSMTVTGVTLTNNVSNAAGLTVTTALAGTGGLTNSTTFNISGTSSITTLANAGTATITGAGAISTALANFTNSGTLNLNGTGTIAGITNSGMINLATSGTITALTNNAAGTLNISTTPTVPTITTLTATVPGNTVNYSGAGNQTVKATTYSNLGLSGSGAKAMGATTINGNFIMSGTATTAPTGALTVGGNFTIGTGTTFTAGNANNHTVSGNFGATGTFTPGTGTVTLNGSAAQTISGTSPVTFNTLNVTNTTIPYNITLSATNVTVATLSGTVNLTPSCPDYTLTSTTPAQTLHSCTMVSSINLASCTSTAATVSWTVTFSRSVTGVDATAFSLAPTGLSGAYITTVSGGGASWTVTANTGIGSGSLGLNQSGPGSVVPPLNGTFTGAVCTITATPALAEYRMDEASWNGTANEVADSSGSGNNAQSFNSASTDGTTPAIAGSPGTCRYGVFDNGGAITQGYVQTPLSDLTSDFTISAWIRTTDNTEANQRILIDDQNNTGGYGLSLADGGSGILRFYSRGITPANLDSTYTIANNTWYFVAAVADITNKMRTIYVFDTAGTLLNSTTEAAWTGAWGTDAGPVSIGAETNASAETPLNFHFRGNLDEVRVYQKVLNQYALAAIAVQTHACPVNIPDHLEIQSSGSGLTCAASTLTIRACANAACTTLYTSGVSGTLTAAGAPTVNWDGTTGGATGAGFVIPNGSSSVTKNVQVATAGTVVFGITSPLPVPANVTACNFGTPACTFTASTAGFIFSDTTAPGNVYTIPTQVSGIATPTFYLRAVQASTTSSAVCTPAIISQTTAVNMGYVCNNPAACQAGNLATINATAVAPGGTAVSLTFDANGSAPITARYDDVGQITLNANKTVTPPNGTAVTLNGTSNSFVVAPHHFGFSGITAGPIKAGNNFSATVTAYNGLATPTATPNFGKETSPESATVTFTKCQPTGINAINGTFSGSVGSFNNGAASAANLNWSEVGNGDLVATLTSGSYLGSGITATGNTGTGGTICSAGTGNVGRFIPDHFDTVIINGCISCGFTYSGQPFAVFVAAKNGLTTPTTTANYDGTANTAPNFAKAVTLSAWDAATGATQNPGPGSLLPPSNTAVPLTAFTQGLASLNAAATMPFYIFTTVPTIPTIIRVRAVDTDNVTSLRAPLSSSTEGQPEIRSGRVKISNAYGSELLQLPIALTAQYWNASSNYVTSTTDSSSSFVVATPPATSAVNFSNYQKNLTTISVVGSPKTVMISTGVGGFTLAAPGTGNNGSVDMSIPALTGASCYVVPIPLGCYLPSAAARATFGVYRGNSNFIYLRENY